MKVVEMTDQHLLNRIKYFERFLVTKPAEQVYIGESDIAESWVEQENRFNDSLESKIKNHIAYMKREAKKRNLL